MNYVSHNGSWKHFSKVKQGASKGNLGVLGVGEHFNNTDFSVCFENCTLVKSLIFVSIQGFKIG